MDSEIKVLNIESGKITKTLSCDHLSHIAILVFLPYYTLLSCSASGEIKFWDLNQSLCLKCVNLNSSVLVLNLLKNGNLAFGGPDNSEIRIWDIELDKCIQRLIGHRRRILTIESLKSGELISSSHDDTIKIWNLETGNCIKTFFDLRIKSVFLHQNSRTIISCTYVGELKFWNIETGICDKTIHINGNERILINEVVLD